MSKLLDIIRHEPVLVTTFVAAALNAAVLFGLPWTVEQRAGAMVAVNALLAIVARALVTPTAKLPEAK